MRCPSRLGLPAGVGCPGGVGVFAAGVVVFLGVVTYTIIPVLASELCARVAKLLSGKAYSIVNDPLDGNEDAKLSRHDGDVSTKGPLVKMWKATNWFAKEKLVACVGLLHT